MNNTAKDILNNSELSFQNSESGDISNLLELALSNLEYSSERKIRYTFLIEEALTKWREELPADAQIKFSSTKKGTKIEYRLEIKGEKVDPFVNTNKNENEIDKMVDNLFAGIGNEIIYKYKKNTNIIVLSLPTKNHDTEIFKRNLIIVMIPIIIQSVFCEIATDIDTVMLGFLNASTMGGVSLMSSFAAISVSTFSGICIGGVSVLSQLFAKNDRKKINESAGFVMLLSIIVSLLFFCVSFFMPNTIAKLYTSDNELISSASEYLKVISFSFIFQGIYRAMYCFIQSTGKVKHILVYSTIGCTVNIISNSLLIFGLFGLPKMGVYGAAISTVFSAFVQAVLSTYYVIKHTKIRIKLFGIAKESRRNLYKIIIPSITQYLTWRIAINVLVSGYGHLGADVVTARSLLFVLYAIILGVKDGFAGGTTVIVGRLLGRNHFEEAKSCANVVLKLALKLAIFSVPIFLILSYILRFMPFDINDNVIMYMNYFMINLSISMVFEYLNGAISLGMLHTGGDSFAVLIIDSVVLWCVIVPITLLNINGILSISTVAMIMILKCDEVVSFPFKYIRFKKYKWLKNLTK